MRTRRAWSLVFGVFLCESVRLSSESDSKPMKTPVHPASAMLRIRLGSSVTSMVTAALQILLSGRSAAAGQDRNLGPLQLPHRFIGAFATELHRQAEAGFHRGGFRG